MCLIFSHDPLFNESEKGEKVKKSAALKRIMKISSLSARDVLASHFGVWKWRGLWLEACTIQILEPPPRKRTILDGNPKLCTFSPSQETPDIKHFPFPCSQWLSRVTKIDGLFNMERDTENARTRGFAPLMVSNVRDRI